MQSSAAVTFRAFLMLACAVGIPVIAVSGASWSALLAKFEKIQLPQFLNPASASTPETSPHEAPQVATRSQAETLPAPSMSERPVRLPKVISEEKAEVPLGIHDIELKLQQFGATYYVLEAWGSDQNLFRFYCKMAVGGNKDYTHCFEATNADPLQAMLHVLKQVESWREEGLSKAPSRA